MGIVLGILATIADVVRAHFLDLLIFIPANALIGRQVNHVFLTLLFPWHWIRNQWLCPLCKGQKVLEGAPGLLVGEFSVPCPFCYPKRPQDAAGFVSLRHLLIDWNWAGWRQKNPLRVHHPHHA
jgi:hypothetical protein